MPLSALCVGTGITELDFRIRKTGIPIIGFIHAVPLAFGAFIFYSFQRRATVKNVTAERSCIARNADLRQARATEKCSVVKRG